MAFSKIIAESMDLTDTYAFTGTVTGAGESNTPHFLVKKTSSQTINDNSTTKVTWDSEIIDSDSAFASDKFTVPSGKAGKYFFQAQVMDYDAAAQLQARTIHIYKNGSSIANSIFQPEHDHGGTANSYMEYTVTSSISFTDNASASDYYEIYYYGNTRDSGSFVIRQNSNTTWFQGFLLTT